MTDNLGIRLKNRPSDSTGKVPAYASYWDTVTDLIEEAIENLSRHGFFEGLLSSPGFSRTNMVVSFDAFECVTEDGIYCQLAAGDVTHETADATNPRIDIICVNPAVQTSEDEITGSGIVQITKGTAAANPLVPDTPSGYLKVQEVDIPAEATEVTLRDWTPMYIPFVMFRPTPQNTPDMTVKVNFGRGYIGNNVLVDKGVQNSPAFTAPAANKCAIDILHIDSSGTLAITQGTEVDLPNEPSAPTYPKDKLVICEVYLEAGDTAIYQTQIRDVRPWLWMNDNAEKIKSKSVDAPEEADDGKALVYDFGNSKYKHSTRKGAITVRITDISTAETLYLMLPKCKVTKIWSVLSGAIADVDATITCYRIDTGLTDGVITIGYDGSAAGDIDSCSPSANNDFNGSDQYLKLVGGGESTNTVPVLITVEFEYKE